MPAVSSSPIAVLSRHLAPLEEVAPEARGGLLEVLESVPDPRKKRGVRHRFAAILFVSVCAVVSGARSFAAIAEWAADAVDDTLRGMGIGAPNASTVRRALSAFTGDGFDTAVGGFLAGLWVPVIRPQALTWRDASRMGFGTMGGRDVATRVSDLPAADLLGCSASAFGRVKTLRSWCCATSWPSCGVRSPAHGPRGRIEPSSAHWPGYSPRPVVGSCSSRQARCCAGTLISSSDGGRSRGDDRGVHPHGLRSAQ
jgi:hypothetical protein